VNANSQDPLTKVPKAFAAFVGVSLALFAVMLIGFMIWSRTMTANAAVSPDVATLPITYDQQATKQTADTHYGSLRDATTFKWRRADTQIINLIGINADSTITGTGTITVSVPPTNVIINGPATGAVNTSYTFTATVSPITATQPITYVWRATGQDPMTQTSDLSHTISLTWSVPSPHIITTTAANGAGAVTNTHIITIHQIVYLPLILNNWPPAPALNPIANDGDGNFTVSWTPPSLGGPYTYTLYEDDDPAFSSPNIYSSQSTLSRAVTGRVCGVYYYRVKAVNEQGLGSWSNTEAAQVTYLTVDDFDDGQDPNVIGGTIEWYGPCVISLPGGYDSSNAYGGSDYGYRLSYSVEPNCYATWQTGLLNKDFSGFATATFQIKGALGNEQPNIYLQNTPFQRYYVNVEDFVPMGRVTPSWQQARIPMSQFTAVGADLTKVYFFQIVFEWAWMSGTVYVDDIYFECPTFAGASD
jgi:hypothetical protein